MTVEQFWEDDPWLVKAFLRANDYIRQRNSNEMHLQGYYNFIAYSTALSNFHIDGKRHKPISYIDEPYRVTPLSEEEKAAKAEEERKKTIAYFDRLAKRFEMVQ